MIYFLKKKLDSGITLIEDYSVTKMYLIEGKERAVLIDTGIGFRRLREYVSIITRLPVDVVITHGHYDHAGGIRQFDKIYMAREDVALLADIDDLKLRLNYARGLCAKHCSPDLLTEEALLNTGENPEIHFLDNLQTFDLGGRILTAIHVPGHTAGTYAFYDDLSESLFLGDACNPSSYMFLNQSVTIEAYLESVKKLEKWIPKTRHCFFQHDYGEIHEEGPVSIITDVKECCEQILNRNDEAVPFTRNVVANLFDTQPLSANRLDQRLMRADGRLGNIIYSPNKIYEGSA